MILDTSLLNTQQYKVCIKGKSRERSSALPLHLGVVAIEKEALYNSQQIYFFYYLCQIFNWGIRLFKSLFVNVYLFILFRSCGWNIV